MIAIPLFIWFMYSREPSTESFSRVPERLLAPLKYHPLFSPASGNIKKFDVWQKYTDPSARFTFYYPPGWKLLVKGDTLSLASAERSLLLRDPRDKTGALPEISITLLPNPTKQSLEQFARVYESGWFTIYRSVKPSTAANKPALVEKAEEVYQNLKILNSKSYILNSFNVAFDARGNIGKRYYSQDEIGTPFCVTVDFQTLEDNTVTVRSRDTMKQERVKVEELINYLN
jgi:hypothetical protein